MKLRRPGYKRYQQTDLHGISKIEEDRKKAIFLIMFGLVRMAVWTIFAIFLTLGLLGVTPFHWASTVAATVVFVTFISLYANWATDLDQVTAAFAALTATDAHHDAEHNREREKNARES